MISLNNDNGRLLRELCEVNGREIGIRADGNLETFDKYDFGDRQIFESVEEAIDWEHGYTTAIEYEHSIQ